MSIYVFNAAIKGALEGLTEFLPISSTGHLILVRGWFPLTGDEADRERLDQLFDIIVQFPAVLAIVVLYRKRIWESFRGTVARSEDRRFWGGLLLAFFPAAIAGLLFHHWVEAHLEKPLPVALALLVGGLVLVLIEWRMKPAPNELQRAEEATWKAASGIGLFQVLSVLFPGTSRSGATIVGGRLLGLSRTAAAEYSFFLALPTMFAACAYKLAKSYSTIQWNSDGAVLLVGSLLSFVTAWCVVALFIRFIQRHSLAPFGWYRIGLGALILAFGGGSHG